MPRIARLVVPDIPHHVTQRGARRQRVFFSAGDGRLYLRLLKEGCEKAKTRIWAWCLMPNHVHLILVPAHEGGLRAALAEPHRRYAAAVNRRSDWKGHLWQERFASFPMDEAYLLACARYVELNPVRAGLVARPEQWMWSSARDHLGLGADGLTETSALLDRWPDWRTVLGSGLDPDVLEEIRKREASGHPLGNGDFLARLSALTARPLACRRRGRPRKSAR